MVKKNTDAKRGYIDEQVSLQKTGTSVNPLENFNIGYEGMSGYNGYPVVLGANKTWETSNAVDYIYDINIPVLGNGNISNGNITISIPFINKGIMFNQSDLETFRQLLTK